MKKKVVLMLPVYNEERIIEDSVNTLHEYMKNNIIFDWKIVIVNNGSTDKTSKISKNLQKKYKNIDYVEIEKKGRGNALRESWKNYDADIYSYCDCDLATDISQLRELFDSIDRGANISTGNRYKKDSQTRRTLTRLITSKTYLFLIKILFNTKVSDFQCGFKAIDKKTKDDIVTITKDNDWFFDTELLLLAEREGYNIAQIPVTWTEKRIKDSKVRVIPASLNNLINLIKLKRRISK